TDHRRTDAGLAQEALLDDAGFLRGIVQRVVQEVLETEMTEHISFGKLNNVREAIEIAREARTVFGGNGVTLDYPPMRHMSNLESVRTYEGTDEVHTLILGGAITGIPAFR
ncbi:MAG: acyl-CoA dehydrogenase, partial [Actinomycetota bacterium]|nr:acyl-CoA dehydrogenase [Actinomycetota bacterium]